MKLLRVLAAALVGAVGLGTPVGSAAVTGDSDPPTLVKVHVSRVIDVNVWTGTELLLHLTDRTGVRSATAELRGTVNGVAFREPCDYHLVLVKGSATDGWWKTGCFVPAWLLPGRYSFSVHLRDRLGNVAIRHGARLEVRIVNDHPDTTPARVTLDAPLEPVDVRSEAASVPITLRVRDDWLGAAGLEVCLRPPQWSGDPDHCRGVFEPMSGNRLDGRYRVRIRLPAGAPGGDWGLDVHVLEPTPLIPAHRKAGLDVNYLDTSTDWFAGRRGRLSVLGSGDNTPPTLVEVSGLGAVHVVDPEGVTFVGLAAHLHDAAPDAGWVVMGSTSLSGTPQDGWWSVPVLPGWDPGSYDLVVTVSDAGHSRRFSVTRTVRPHDPWPSGVAGATQDYPG